MIYDLRFKNKIREGGFSLIELIVVITIIAVITTIGVVSYQSANVKSRDNKRMADLEKVRIALELYRQEVGTYPAADANGQATGLVTAYLQVWPTDPKVSQEYRYFYTRVTNYTYTLDAYLETGGASLATNCSSGSTPVSCNYRVTNP